MNNLQNKNILCYSHYKFDNIMENRGWYIHPGINCSAISICSLNEYDLSEHWFKDDCHNSTILSVFNLDIDDCGPMWFTGDEYDKALELYLAGHVKESNEYFNCNYQTTDIHILNYEEAFDLVKWIDDRIHNFDNTIYIHCAVGASRSQGVVRYILDTYGQEFNIKTNPENPCLTPNAHVTLMLKRAYRELFYNDIDDSYFIHKKATPEELEKITGIKLNRI